MLTALSNSGRRLAVALTWALAGTALAQTPVPQSAAAATRESAAPRTAAPAVPGDTPAHWLARMNQALTTRNYDGTFAHWHEGRVEMLRIIHRVQDGTVSERLASLDGSGREFIRTGASLSCYLPDQRTVLVEQRPPQESLVSFPAVNPEIASSYDMRELGRVRLNRRATHLISVSARDEYRYGYRLWIDDATAMPIKTQLCDAHGRVIEQVVFASLTLPVHIPDSAFRPEVSTEGFQWLRNEVAPTTAAGATASLAWSALRLPPGFRMSARSEQLLPGSSTPVDHVVFTDGVASVSVFVEPQRSHDDGTASELASSVGSTSAFSTVANGRKITAVGEVPPDTVRFIANQVQVQESSAFGARRH